MGLLKEWNYFKYRFRYHYGKNLNLKKPVDVSLELSSQCNMACSYCYHSKDNEAHLPFKKGLMDTKIAMEIVKQSAKLGVHAIKFNYRGESTIHPDFNMITSLAKSYAKGPIFIDRLTNSNFKFRTDRDDIFDGLCNQTKVKVSYDSFIKKVFETQRAGGDHDLTTRNIEKFYHYPKRRNTELVIQAVRTQLNKNEDIESEVRRRWPEATVSIREVVEGRKEGSIDQLVNNKRDLKNRQACTQAFVRLIFLQDGRANVCCPDIANDLVVGDVTTHTVAEIFNSAKARMLRNQLKTKEAFKFHKACLNCPSFESYAGFVPKWES